MICNRSYSPRRRRASTLLGYVRPPESVYPPGGVVVRRSPVPLRLLHAMRDGARLHERAWRWTEWTLLCPGQPPQKVGERAVNGLVRHAFIARDGTLPGGRLPRWFEFNWSITDAGKKWLASPQRGRKSEFPRYKSG